MYVKFHNINKKTANEAVSKMASSRYLCPMNLLFCTQVSVHKLLFFSLKNKYDLLMKLTLQKYIM